MRSYFSSNTQSVIDHGPVFAGRNKDVSREYKPTLCACLSLYSKLVFELLQGKAQPSSSLTDANAAEQT